MTVTITKGLPFPPGHPFHGGSQIVFVQKHQEPLAQQSKKSLQTTSKELTLKLLPPEIDKLIREHLNRTQNGDKNGSAI